MSEPQPQKKKNKKKKKPIITTNPAPVPPVPVSQNGSDKDAFSINEVLPQKVGMKTVFKDVEVTMTHSGDAIEATNDIAKKKKKKKKKAKQQTSENTEEPVLNGNENPNSFFKFNEDHIELVNHPEISVTLSKTLESEVKKSPESEEVPVISEQKTEEANVTAPSANSKKKRKRKKKKNTESEVPPDPAAESVDPSYTAPTYVKLPASGDNCVLLVSHESFSSDNKTLATSSDKTTQNSSSVLIQSKEKVEDSKNTSELKSDIQPQNSVSILPVSEENKKLTCDKTDEKNMDSSSKKVNNLIKMEANVSNPPEINPTENGTTPNEGTALTKAQLKAERRAKQEAQRAAKLAKTAEKDSSNLQISNETATKRAAMTPKESATTKESPIIKKNVPQNTDVVTSKSISKPSAEREVFRKAQIFSHLPQYKDFFAKEFNDNLKIHPSILEIGSHYSKGILCGSNARCVGFLGAFRDVIRDYNKPPNKNFARDLESKLQIYLTFLNNCRPLSVSITNAVKFLKHQINHLSNDISEDQAKKELCLSINNFVKEEILLAKEAICISASAKIVDGDNILVFAYSSLVKDVLCKAHDQNKVFHVVVVDCRPKREGLDLLRCLVKHGLQCSYVSIYAASYIMKKVSKVIIGAHALLSNGCVMSRLGSKQLALIASSYSVPVLVCCETYKFCERALTDSFVHNELGDPENLVKTSLDKNDGLKNWQSMSSLQICNILYDVTPSDLISVVITEKGLLPCTSVPVVLRVKHAGLQE